MESSYHLDLGPAAPKAADVAAKAVCVGQITPAVGSGPCGIQERELSR